MFKDYRVVQCSSEKFYKIVKYFVYTYFIFVPAYYTLLYYSPIDKLRRKVQHCKSLETPIKFLNYLHCCLWDQILFSNIMLPQNRQMLIIIFEVFSKTL